MPVTISISVEFENLQNMFIKSLFDYLKATFSSSGCIDDEFNIIICLGFFYHQFRISAKVYTSVHVVGVSMLGSFGTYA